MRKDHLGKKIRQGKLAGYADATAVKNGRISNSSRRHEPLKLVFRQGV
jgi:hypothetical protein